MSDPVSRQEVLDLIGRDFELLQRRRHPLPESDARLAFGQIEIGHQVAQPLDQDGVLVAVIVADHALLIRGSFGHRLCLKGNRPRTT